MAAGKGLFQRVGQALLGGDRALNKLLKQARQLQNDGQFDQAALILGQAHAALTPGQASAALASAYQDLALALEQADAGQTAVQYWLMAVELLDKSSDSADSMQFVTVALETARRLFLVKDVTYAEKLLRKAVKQSELLGMTAELIEIAFLLGICADERKQPVEAETWFQRVFQLANNDTIRILCKETVLRTGSYRLAAFRQANDKASEEKLIEELIELYLPEGDLLLVLNDLSASATLNGQPDLGLALGHRFAKEAEQADFDTPGYSDIEFHCAASLVGLAQNYHRHQLDDAAAILHGRKALEKARLVARGPQADEFGGIYLAALQTLALPLLRSGNYIEGRPLIFELHEHTATQLGKESPEYAKYLWDESDLFRLIDSGLSLTLNEQAVKAFEGIVGANHLELVMPLHTLSDRYFACGDLLAAEDVLLRAFSIVNEALGQNHPSLIEYGLISKYRYLLSAQKRYADAETMVHQELSLTQEHFQHDVIAVGQAYAALSSVYYHQKRFAEAAEPLQLYQSLYETTFGRHSPEFIGVLIREGIRLFASGETAKAWEQFVKTEELTREFSQDPNQVVCLAFFMAQTQQRLGNTSEAIQYDKHAIAILKQSYPPDKLPDSYVMEILELIDGGDLAGILHGMDAWLERAEQVSARTPLATQVKVLEWRSRLLSSMGQLEQSSQLLNQATVLISSARPEEPLVEARLWERCAMREIFAGRVNPSRELAEKALAIRQQHAPSTSYLTETLLQRLSQPKSK